MEYIIPENQQNGYGLHILKTKNFCLPTMNLLGLQDIEQFQKEKANRQGIR